VPTSLDASISVHDFNRGLLPADARRIGTERFRQAVGAFYKDLLSAVGGTTTTRLDGESIHISWKPDRSSKEPFEYALALLQRGDLDRGVPLMEVLLAAEPRNADVLYNLGMAYSDTGRTEDAIELLSRAVEVDPENANAFVALGVAYQRNGEPSKALEALRRAVALDPANSYAHRNLGGILASLGGLRDAEPHLREAVRLTPDDQQAIYGLAATLHKLGEDAQVTEADELCQRAIESDPTSQVAEIARQARSSLAQESFRDTTGSTPRMDAVMYCLNALEKFNAMTEEQVQAITLEIALLGRQGLDTNDPTPKYTLRSLPGDFTGLHLVSLMYVGFERIAPGHDMGFDLSDEYAAARQLFSQQEGQR